MSCLYCGLHGSSCSGCESHEPMTEEELEKIADWYREVRRI